MQNSRTIFLEAIKHFPRWMDIRKRPLTSVGGHFLRSIIEELDEVQRTLVDFKNEFFILTYVGREHTVIDYLYTAKVGNVGDGFELTVPAVSITEDPGEFLRSTEPIALLQEGYLLFRTEHVPADGKVLYSVDGYKYSIDAVKFHVWNVIDEFAKFSSLERYDGEDNAQLLKRCLLSFKNPTNSTEGGLKNAIINAVSNYASLSQEDITIEIPDENNLVLADDEFGTIYERLAQFNQDIFRTKRWDMGYWEHGFKKLAYVPHVWDAPIDVYQDGVGQSGSLQTVLTGEMKGQETTDVSITGYQKSEIIINEYIREQKIEQSLDLSLKKYDNVLKAKEIEYKITASDVKEVPADDIILNSYRQSEGESEHYISDLALDVRGATVVQRNKLSANSKYKLKFYPKSAYADMLIDRANVTYANGVVKNLLIENSIYKNVNNVFQNTDVALHASAIKHFKTFSNIVDTKDGVTLSDQSAAGSFTVDVTGMGGKLIKIGHECRAVDITKNSSFVTYNGFELTPNGELAANGTDSTSSITIELDCNSIAWELAAAANPSHQGSCTVLFYVDGKIDPTSSGLWSSGRKISKSFDKFSHVKVEIQKSGMNPVVIKDISASRYEINYRTAKGNIIVTPFSRMLPVLPAGESNTLTVEFKSYSAFAPTISYVHIGASLTNACYTTQEISTGAAPATIDISSNCIVKLYETTSGKDVLLSDNFITKPAYRNNTSGPATVIIDTSHFLTITRATPAIEKTTENGSVVSYITIQPGKEIDSIVIEGSSLMLVDTSTLNKLLRPGSINHKVYVSKALKGFVIQNPATNEETIVHLTRNKLNGMADVFTFNNLPLNITGCFIVDKGHNVESIGKSFEHSFEEAYLVPSDTQEYIAYNKTTALQSTLRGVQIVDTFMPLMPPNKLMIYTVANVDNPNVKATVNFEKAGPRGPIYESWSLGRKSFGLCIDVDMGYDNSDSYELDMKQLNKKFIISNSIDLDAEYEVEGQITELARYIITPPAKMKIVYESKDYGEEIIVEEDGFNKLYFSNIEAIEKIIVDGVIVPIAMYELLSQEGIVVWKTDAYDGRKAQVYCSYKAPKYLSFISLESLYELAGYSVDAYRVINATPIVLHDLADGAIKVLDFGMTTGYPDKTIVRCSNPSFQAKVENGNVLKVAKTNAENVVAIKTGYFYDQGTEYYQFNSLHTEVIDRMSNIELHNVRRMGDALVFIQRSTNYLKDSAMKQGRIGELCNVDFINNKNIKGLSRIDSLTACDSYNCWVDFDMDVAFANGENGRALAFTANSDDSYAVMDITRFVKPNTIITLSATGALNIQIAKEIKCEGSSYSKALFAQPLASFVQNGAYQQFVFDDTVDMKSEYYLLLTGSGILDDIVVKDYVPQETPSSIHKKNINAIGLSIDERPQTNYQHKFLFDIEGNRMNGVELDDAGKLQMGADADWGLTKIYDARNDWESCVLTDLKMGKEAIYSQKRAGTVVTPPIYLRNRKSIKSLIAKVNDVVIGKLEGFKISILAGSQPGGKFNEVVSHDETNTVKAFQNKLMSYVKVKVEMPIDRVINNIEVFVEYAETADPMRIKVNSTGDLITKVYDTGYLAKFKPVRIEAQGVTNPKKVRMFVRGCREDANRSVWTGWKPLVLDANLYVTGDATVFDNYRLFQFKICLDDKASKLLIDSFVFEVMK